MTSDNLRRLARMGSPELAEQRIRFANDKRIEEIVIDTCDEFAPPCRYCDGTGSCGREGTYICAVCWGTGNG